MRKIILFNLVVVLACSIYMNEVILTDEVFYHSLGDQLSSDQISSILGVADSMALVDYTLAALAYLLKIVIIAALIYLILTLNEIQATYSETMEIVSKSFTIFLVPVVIKLLVLSFSTSAISLDDIQFFSFGSLLNLFDPTELDNWMKVILQSINIWEVSFLFILAFQLKKYFGNDFNESIKNVTLSYGSGLAVWICFVVFLTITFS